MYVFIDKYGGEGLTDDVSVSVWRIMHPAMPIETKSVESQHHPVYAVSLSIALSAIKNIIIFERICIIILYVHNIY